MRLIALVFILFSSAASALAETEVPAAVPFASGEFTFAIGEDEEMALSYAGQEVHRAPMIKFDRIVTVAGVEAALFQAGDGGDGCGPQMLIFTMPQDAVDPVIDIAGEECGAPEPAVTQDALVFLPTVSPGGGALVQRWTPGDGVKAVGYVTFTPQPDTGWDQFDPSKAKHPNDLFDNAEIYAALEELTGDRFEEFVDKLQMASAPQLIDGKFLAAPGCQPSACATDKGFAGLDIPGKAVFAAFKAEDGTESLWPADKATWPEALIKAWEASKAQ